MIEADEIDVAIDELRWLLEGCSDFIVAHKTLGELALMTNDYSLARGHFGYAFQIGKSAIERARATRVPYRLPDNQAFFEAGKGLTHCLIKLDKQRLAIGVARDLIGYDPSDPLNVRGLIESVESRRDQPG